MPIHRLRQGLRALFAFARPVDDTLAAHYLTPPEFALFKSMRRGEQLHSLNVLRAVLAQGDTPPDLAVAALLHDVGKSRYPLAVWQKTAAVLVRAFAPAQFRRLSQRDSLGFWSRPFAVSVQHPQWSAEMLAQAGASAAAIWLVAHHQDASPNAPEQGSDRVSLLKRLQSADDAN